jgi:Predicted membrane protein
MSGDGKGWANPAPAGLVALGLACFTFYYILLGYESWGFESPAGALPLLGCWLMGGFVIQVIVGIVELMEGNTTGGNVFTVFSAFFMLAGGLEFFVKYFAAANKWPIALNTVVDGWAWLALAVFIVLWTPAYFKGTSILALAVIFLDIAVVAIALMDLKILDKATGDPIAAYTLLITGILALYLSAALVLNTAFGKSILPITGPWAK